MRTLLCVTGLYLGHRVLRSLSPAYAAHMRHLDRRLTWVSIILVVYLLVNALLGLFYYGR